MDPVEQPQAAPARLPRQAWRLALAAFAAWLVSRALLIVVSYGTFLFNSSGLSRDRGQIMASSSFHDYLRSWEQWDAVWYLEIAHRGYFSERSTAFFPLFPALVRGLTTVLGHRYYLAAGLIVANLAALVAFYSVARLAADEVGPDLSGPVLRLLIASPVAFFLFAPYTEGLFIALATGSLVAARRGRWVWSGLLALGSSLTRPTGIALVLPLGYEYGRQLGWWGSSGPPRTAFKLRQLGGGLLLAGSIPLAVLGYAGYLGLRFGRPLLFLSVQSTYWHRDLAPPWVTAWAVGERLFTAPPFSYQLALQLMDLAAIVATAVLLVAGWRRMAPMLSLYSGGILLLAVASPVMYRADILVSAIRLVVVATPLLLVLAPWAARRPWLETGLIGGGFMLQAVLLTAFQSGIWVA